MEQELSLRPLFGSCRSVRLCPWAQAEKTVCVFLSFLSCEDHRSWSWSILRADQYFKWGECELTWVPLSKAEFVSLYLSLVWLGCNTVQYCNILTFRGLIPFFLSFFFYIFIDFTHTNTDSNLQKTSTTTTTNIQTNKQTKWLDIIQIYIMGKRVHRAEFHCCNILMS